MTSVLTDTDPEIERMQIRLIRKAPLWRRIQTAVSLAQVTAAMSRRALRRRYPTASRHKLDQLFVELHYGRTVVSLLTKHNRHS